MDKLAEFVRWTMPMVYETKTQNVDDFTYFVSQTRGMYEMFPLSILWLNSPVRTPLLDKRLVT